MHGQNHIKSDQWLQDVLPPFWFIITLYNRTEKNTENFNLKT